MVREIVPYDKSLAYLFKDLAFEWDTTKNLLPPERVFSQSTLEAWWICRKEHNYKSRVHNRTSKGKGCPYCSNKKVLPGFNDLESIHPKTASLWDHEKNDIKPYEVTSGSGLKIWWTNNVCSHSWIREVRYAVNNNDCPYCSNTRLLKGFNDLLTHSPKVAAEWDSFKNDVSPTEILFNSTKRVWWICSKGHEWKTQIGKRTIAFSNCRKCYRNSRTSRLEYEILSLIKSVTNYHVESSNNSIIHPYEIDIFIPELNIGFEVNGNYWHSNESIELNTGLTASAYHEMKLRKAFEKDVDLYFIWESDWRLNQDKVRAAIDGLIKGCETSSESILLLRSLEKD